mmetsp:Transcript_33518/g.85757  ORF Transcript_33518/g.85757 Transcript_33518/m.85757 type:complete len:111 (-) Transcript_33518:400-732(-)
MRHAHLLYFNFCILLIFVSIFNYACAYTVLHCASGHARVRYLYVYVRAGVCTCARGKGGMLVAFFLFVFLFVACWHLHSSLFPLYFLCISPDFPPFLSFFLSLFLSFFIQ